MMAMVVVVLVFVDSCDGNVGGGGVDCGWCCRLPVIVNNV